MIFYKIERKNPLIFLGFSFFLLSGLLGVFLHSGVLLAQDKASEKIFKPKSWEEVLMPRAKHNFLLFMGPSQGTWQSSHSGLAEHSTDFLFTYRYYMGAVHRTSFFLGSSFGYSVDSQKRASGYLGSKIFLPGPFLGMSFFLNTKLRTALAANISLVRYLDLEVGQNEYALTAQNFDFSLTFEYFFSKNWAMVTCLNHRTESFQDLNLSFRDSTRNSWGVFAGISYHKL